MLKHVKAPYHPYHPYRPCLAISSILLGMSQPPKNLQSPGCLRWGTCAAGSSWTVAGGLAWRGGFLKMGYPSNGSSFSLSRWLPLWLGHIFILVYQFISVLSVYHGISNKATWCWGVDFYQLVPWGWCTHPQWEPLSTIEQASHRASIPV